MHIRVDTETAQILWVDEPMETRLPTTASPTCIGFIPGESPQLTLSNLETMGQIITGHVSLFNVLVA